MRKSRRVNFAVIALTQRLSTSLLIDFVSSSIDTTMIEFSHIITDGGSRKVSFVTNEAGRDVTPSPELLLNVLAFFGHVTQEEFTSAVYSSHKRSSTSRAS